MSVQAARPRPARRGLVAVGAGLTLAWAAAAACSHVDHRWLATGYRADAPGAVKRVGVAVRAPSLAGQQGLGEVLGQVAESYVKLQRNYLLPRPPVAGGLEQACAGERVDGALLLHALEAAQDGDRATLTLRAELWRCRGPALLWHAQGHRSSRVRDPNLDGLTASYRASLGETAARWTAVTFALVQELAGSLPDPVLSDQEVEEKIDQGV